MNLRNAIAEIEQFYGGVILNGGILESVWISELEKLSLPQLQVGIARCFKNNPKKYGYFPSVNDILELARGSTPTENAQAYVTPDLSQAALPAAYTGISPEEAEANKKEVLIGRLYLLNSPHLSAEEKQNFHSKMREFEVYQLEQMVEVAKLAPRVKAGGWEVAHQVALDYFENLVSRPTKSEGNPRNKVGRPCN